MKRIFTIVASLLITASVWAQAPQKMSYQAVVRNATNNLVTSQAVGMQISVLQGGASGTPVYVETQTPTTNANGLVSLEIGMGTVLSGDFTTIDWANDTYFIKTETDPTGGTSYTITGTTQLMSVPYALHSRTADSITGTVNYTETDPIFGVSVANGITAADTVSWNNKLDVEMDSSITNEIQVLSISNDTIFLSNGGYAKLPTGFDGQYSSLTGVPINVSTFTNDAGYLTTELDGSVTNELQALSISNDTIFLSNGGFAKLPAGFNGQYTSLIGVPTNVSTFTNDAGYLTTELDGSVTNELQALSISNDTIFLSNGGFAKLPTGFDGQYSSLTGAPTNVSTFTNDAGYLTTELDGSVTNELQALSISNDTIFLSNGGFAKLPVGFDGQYSSLSGAPTNVSTFTNDAGYLATEVDSSITNEIQTLSVSVNSLTISGTGGNTVGIDGSRFNEIQSLGLTGNTLSLSFGGGSVILPATPWTTSGSDIYRAGTGKVGINTTTPLATLDVDGDIRGTSFKLLNVGSTGNRFKIGTNVNGIDTDIEYGTGWLTFMPTPSNVAFALDNNGNAIMGLGTNKVGIGTASPTEKLEVNGKIKSGNTRMKNVAVNAINTTSTSYVDIPNMTTTFTSGNLPVMIQVSVPGTWSSIAGNVGVFRLLIDGVPSDFVQAQYVSGSDVKQITLMHIGVLSAASHTVAVQWYSTGGSLNASWGGGNRQVLIWE